jgi:hypothetical protein
MTGRGKRRGALAGKPVARPPSRVAATAHTVQADTANCSPRQTPARCSRVSCTSVRDQEEQRMMITTMIAVQAAS